MKNKKIYLSLVTIVIITVIISSCVDNKKAIRRPLYFVDQIEKDTADFIHLKQISNSLSIEILGKLYKVTDSAYILSFQIGTYGWPGFDWQQMSLNPDSVTLSFNGIKAQVLLSTVKLPYTRNPWDALSLHFFSFPMSLLQKEILKSPLLEYNIDLDGYASYNNTAIEIKSITIIDPWLAKVTATP